MALAPALSRLPSAVAAANRDVRPGAGENSCRYPGIHPLSAENRPTSPDAGGSQESEKAGRGERRTGFTEPRGTQQIERPHTVPRN